MTIRFIQARNYRPGRIAPISLIVLHTMENSEKPSSAEAVANWFASLSAPMASAHYCVDNDSIVQCVHEYDTAWHAPGANANGIGIEHAGRASQTADQWADDYSSAMLALSVELVAGICKRRGIPAQLVDPSGLVAGLPGITTHAFVSRAFRKSTHTDPGAAFPLHQYIADVAARLAGV